MFRHTSGEAFHTEVRSRRDRFQDCAFLFLGSQVFWFRYIIEQHSVQFSHSVVLDSAVTPWTAAYQASLSITNSRSLLKLMFIESVMPSNHLILCHPLLPPSIFPSIRVFSNESVLCIRWPKYQSFSFSIGALNEYSGLISFEIDWFYLITHRSGSSQSTLRVFIRLRMKAGPFHCQDLGFGGTIF